MRYVCQICGYLYDDAKEKVPFSELPDDWKCPLCGAAKQDFKAEELLTAKPAVSAAMSAPAERPSEGAESGKAEKGTDLQKLSAGQLAALMSNLARGCEKQYKAEEAGLFRKLADYFTAAAEPVKDAAVEKLAADLQTDIDAYLAVRGTAVREGDRGANRATVWGEKVTRMLSSLVGRYLREGEPLLENTDIWVCGACGFVYVGDTPPELCPVCKVPAWKFEKVEGRART